MNFHLLSDFMKLDRQVLEDMEMLSAFTSVLHIPNLSKPEHVLAVLEEHDIFNKQELFTLSKRMSGHKYVSKEKTKETIPFDSDQFNLFSRCANSYFAEYLLESKNCWV